MKFGIVLPCWIYNATRHELANAAFESLVNTEPAEERASLFVVSRADLTKGFEFIETIAASPELAFTPIVAYQPDNIGGTEQTLAWGTEQAFELPGVTHVVWMGDDALFNPKWLIELQALINRHPDARSWSVYRSAHVAFHAPLVETDLDVQVRSICGHGMTFSKEEWLAWDVHWSQGQAWPNPYAGNTLDLHHAWKREGERWCTKRSYVEHTGKYGLHCTPAIPEYAVDFAGVGA